MDVHNRDVVGNYFTSVTAQGFIPLITFPTRFSDLRGTLIDNCLYKISARSSKTTSGIMIRKFSDHQPYFTCLDLTSHHVKPPRLINICKQNEENILSFKHDLLSVNLLDNLDLNPLANPNDNYNELDNIIQTVKNKHFLRNTIKYNKYKHKKSEWITKGIMKSIKFRNNLYRQIRSTSPLDPVINTYRTNLRNYNKILRQSIKNAKKELLY